jgi:uncharacterized protein YbjT (DUF2867 family)
MKNAETSIIFLGATGAVGGIAMDHLRDSPLCTKLTILARRAFDTSKRTHVFEHIVDTTDSKTYTHALPGHDVAICTMGVGEPSKVSAEEFKRIDHDAVLDFAKACKQAGINRFILLGSVGADTTSRSRYLKSKGALRDAIAALGFASFHIFQPSVIITPTNRYGFSQAVLLAVWPAVSNLLLGGLSKYRGIRIETLGLAIAKSAFVNSPGVKVLHWEDIEKLAKP